MMHKATKVLWHYQNRHRNPEYEAGLRTIHVSEPLRSCLKHANADCSPLKTELSVKTRPKWLTKLGYQEMDPDTGELFAEILELETNELKSSNRKKIKSLDAFCNYYQPLYQKREVSLLFHTFTKANDANISFRRMLDNVRLRYAKLGYPVRGFIWTAEVSYENSQEGHWHYHLCVAVSRISLVKMPKLLKFENLWGKRTQVAFVKKNVKHYMAKYFAKQNARVIGTRSFGKSRKFV